MHRLVFLKRYRIILLIITVGIVIYYFTPDFTSYPKSLDAAFQKAENNQSELKKVIRHYSWFASDSLKRKAAIFLIENMDTHSSYQSEQWEKFQVELEMLFKKEHEESKLKQGFDSIYTKYDLSDVVYLSDLETIKARFLIRSIDYAFEKWKTPYAKHLTFEEFCEYLLPYRAGNEPLENWQALFNEHYIPEVFSLIKKPSDSISSEDICKALRVLKDGYLNYPPEDVPDYNVRMLLSAKTAACKQYSMKIQLAARCIGVPVVLDYTPQWATRSMGHEWNSLITKNGKPLSFSIKDDCELGKHIELIPDRIPPKVYRKTFSKQKESLSVIHGTEEIPSIFATPCMKDVTKDYYQTVDVPVTFNFSPPAHQQFAYLAVFNNRDWVPVCWAKTTNGKAVFKNLHKGILCLPCYYHKMKLIPSGYPIKIDSLGILSIIKPDLKKTEKLVLNRKYQTSLVDGICKRMIDARLQASNDSDFVNAVDLYTITEKPQSCYQVVSIKQPKAYRYYRYLSPKQVTCNLAELEFYKIGCKTKKIGKIIGGSQKRIDTNINNPEWLKIPFYIRLQKPETIDYQIVPSFYSRIKLFPKSSKLERILNYNSERNSQHLIINNTQIPQKNSNTKALSDTCYANAFDNNPLTFFCKYGMEHSWVGMEFKKPVKINKIAFLPRNDDNCILNGELYELFYWDNKWISLGTQTGSNETYRLTYNNAPKNALFLLRNLTKGIEERIFTYENGKQVWW